MVRFTMRELMIAIALVAVGFGWFAEHKRVAEVRAELKQAKIEAIREKRDCFKLSGRIVAIEEQLFDLGYSLEGGSKIVRRD